MILPEHDKNLVWFAIRTNIRCENRAAEGLRAKGLRVFVPEETVMRKRRRREKPEKVKRPLFTRYIFVGAEPGMPVKTDVPATWVVMIRGQEQEIKGYQAVVREIPSVEHAFFDIRRTDGVEGIVGINGRPVAIPRKLVSELIYGVVSGIFDTTKEPFAVGDRVRMADGPYKDVLGEIVKAKRSKRLDVVLSLFGTKHKVEVAASELRAA